MKKIVLSLFLLISSSSLFAQEVGLRSGLSLGNYVGFDAIVSVGNYSRIHTNVSFGSSLGLEAILDFVYQPLLGDENLYWYAGVGASTLLGDPFGLGANAELGLQYNFDDVPISLSMDWRPVFWLVRGDTSEDTIAPFESALLVNNFGVNVRYMLGR